MQETNFITEFDQYLFGNGTHYDLYNKLGAHPTAIGDKEGVYFAVWAPNAKSVSVVGDFNGWNTQAHPMKRMEPMGIYELFIEGICVGDIYKYCVTAQSGAQVMKADPYAFQAEVRPNNASVVADISGFVWNDEKWLKKRKKFNEKKSPMFVYEVHPGSWMKHAATEENPDGFYNYRELAVKLT